MHAYYLCRIIYTAAETHLGDNAINDLYPSNFSLFLLNVVIPRTMAIHSPYILNLLQYSLFICIQSVNMSVFF